MPGTVTEKANVKAEHVIHKVKDATAAFADAFDEGIDTAKHVGKRTSDAAEELMDDTVQRIKRHPTETVVAAFVFGVLAGGFIDCMIRRR